MPEWSPQEVVGEELARSLAADLLPAFAEAPMRLFGEGWDSTVWLLGDEWVLRFPRREVVVPGFLRELEVLPLLAPRLPGRELPDAPAGDAGRVRHGRDLGRFLRALHGIDPADVPAAGELLPVD